MRQTGSLQAIYEAYQDKVDFWWIYTKEAHASDGDRPSRSVKIAQHKTLAERKTAAATCSAGSVLKIPVLVDDMKNSVSSAYSALPERFIILNANKTVAYTGGRGPRGVDAAEFKAALEKLVKTKKP